MDCGPTNDTRTLDSSLALCVTSARLKDPPASHAGSAMGSSVRRSESAGADASLVMMTELKFGREDEGDDGHEQPPLSKHQNHAVPLNTRAVIEATLRRLHEDEHVQRQREKEARHAQRDHTRSLVKLMHLDSVDQAKIVTHTAKVRLHYEINTVMDTMRRIEERHQAEKKQLALIPDKTERHRFMEQARARRSKAIAPLRERLKELDPDARPPTSYEQSANTGNQLPALQRSGSSRKATSKVFREVSDEIRHLQKTRKEMNDPYMANLKMAKLWMKINDPERALENYEKAIKSLSENDKSRIPEDALSSVLENERRRKREALKFLFLRALERQAREDAAKWMRQYLDLSTEAERIPSVEYLEALLRKQEYVEDASLMSPEAVTETILCNKSLGVLTDLRFELLQELLGSSPCNPYLLEAVANMHVRKHDFTDAETVCDRFVALPQVQRMHVFATFAEYSPGSNK